MDVHDAVRKRPAERRPKHAHEPGEADERHAAAFELLDQRPIVIVARGIVAMRDHQRLDARRARPLEALGIGAIRNHDGDRRVERAVLRRVDERLQIAPASGDQNGQEGDGAVSHRSGQNGDRSHEASRHPQVDAAIGIFDDDNAARNGIRIATGWRPDHAQTESTRC